jgi:hypothetical protein
MRACVRVCMLRYMLILYVHALLLISSLPNTHVYTLQVCVCVYVHTHTCMYDDIFREKASELSDRSVCVFVCICLCVFLCRCIYV